MSEAVVACTGLAKTYQGPAPVEVLRGVDLEVRAGERIAIMGKSGSGKSTLLHLLGGMDRPTGGQLTINGLTIETASEAQLTCFRREQIGFVFQFFNLLASLNALENVCLPLLARGQGLRQAQQLAADMLNTVGLASRQHHRPAELSGGEQQRVAIARAMVGRPGLILADEPTGDLDAANAESILALMRDLNRALGATFIIASHNESLVRPGDRILELHSGQLKER